MDILNRYSSASFKGSLRKLIMEFNLFLVYNFVFGTSATLDASRLRAYFFRRVFSIVDPTAWSELEIALGRISFVVSCKRNMKVHMLRTHGMKCCKRYMQLIKTQENDVVICC